MGRPPVPRPKPRVGAPSKYPWKDWLKPGAKHLLKQGKDFSCSMRSMIIYFYQRASKAGCKVSITEIDGSKILVEAHK